ncbi:glycoside hydrolase superfamily [Massariosphaeria phaeospora]|uniref:alpha-galactosidase n=1 Tax=Massariosphaeria phaeospora TaxID=100035 RepID=A0A7C8IA42_9PLEO|nr:glycoside hydrolase superfamily [Massariosphaeria phaeospora]
MHYTTALTLLTGSLAIAAPLDGRAVTQFPKGTSWDIVLNTKSLELSDFQKAPGTAIDIDLFDLSQPTNRIAELAKTKKVICYFSAGSREDWRPGAAQFRPSDYGRNMIWKGENWVDVKSPRVREIMKARIELAAKSGCHAVDPDNVDGYSAYADYVNYLASVAKQNNLAIGLKNALAIIPAVLPNIQFAINEQCHEFGECTEYAQVSKANLAVFNVEYELKDCSHPTGVVLSSVFKPLDLDTVGGQC